MNKYANRNLKEETNNSVMKSIKTLFKLLVFYCVVALILYCIRFEIPDENFIFIKNSKYYILAEMCTLSTILFLIYINYRNNQPLNLNITSSKHSMKSF